METNWYEIEPEKKDIRKTHKRYYSVHGIPNLALSHLYGKIIFVWSLTILNCQKLSNRNLLSPAEKQIAFWLPFAKWYCISTASFQRNILGKIKTLPANKYSQTHHKLNLTEKVKGTRNCKEREIIYAAQCSKLKVLYIGHTGEQLSRHFSKHRYDIKNKADNNGLAKHFQKGPYINDNLNVTTLQDYIETEATRRYHEVKWICKLKTLAPHGLNTEIDDYAKEMQNFY